MPEKKELNAEQLEKVSGGGYKKPEEINWRFNKDAKAYVELDDGTKIEGKVDKRGYLSYTLNALTDVYHIKCETNSSLNKWYYGDKFVGNTIKYNMALVIEPNEYPW